MSVLLLSLLALPPTDATIQVISVERDAAAIAEVLAHIRLELPPETSLETATATASAALDAMAASTAAELAVVIPGGGRSISVVQRGAGALSRTFPEPLSPYAMAIAAVELIRLVRGPPPPEPATKLRFGGGFSAIGSSGDERTLLHLFASAAVEVPIARSFAQLGLGPELRLRLPTLRDGVGGSDTSYSRLGTALAARFTAHWGDVAGVASLGPALSHVQLTATRDGARDSNGRFVASIEAQLGLLWDIWEGMWLEVRAGLGVVLNPAEYTVDTAVVREGRIRPAIELSAGWSGP